MKLVAPAFGGINLEDIAAPRCFEVEERLRKELDIPVFHDDQHGTAVVVLAALLNALKIVRKDPRTIRVVVTGVGAAGTATIKILQSTASVTSSASTSTAPIHRESDTRHGLHEALGRLRHQPAPGQGHPERGARARRRLHRPLGPGILSARDLKRMARDPIVFAMANPDPEIRPEEAERHVRVMATGRSDYPNQINNVLCFPGFFRGLLDAARAWSTTR